MKIKTQERKKIALLILQVLLEQVQIPLCSMAPKATPDLCRRNCTRLAYFHLTENGRGILDLLSFAGSVSYSPVDTLAFDGSCSYFCLLTRRQSIDISINRLARCKTNCRQNLTTAGEGLKPVPKERPPTYFFTDVEKILYCRKATRSCFSCSSGFLNFGKTWLRPKLFLEQSNELQGKAVRSFPVQKLTLSQYIALPKR